MTRTAIAILATLLTTAAHAEPVTVQLEGTYYSPTVFLDVDFEIYIGPENVGWPTDRFPLASPAPEILVWNEVYPWSDEFTIPDNPALWPEGCVYARLRACSRWGTDRCGWDGYQEYRIGNCEHDPPPRIPRAVPEPTHALLPALILLAVLGRWRMKRCQ